MKETLLQYDPYWHLEHAFLEERAEQLIVERCTAEILAQLPSAENAITIEAAADGLHQLSKAERVYVPNIHHVVNRLRAAMDNVRKIVDGETLQKPATSDDFITALFDRLSYFFQTTLATRGKSG